METMKSPEIGSPLLEKQDFQDKEKVVDWAKEQLDTLQKECTTPEQVLSRLLEWNKKMKKIRKQDSEKKDPVNFLHTLEKGESATFIAELQMALKLLYKKQQDNKYVSPGLIDGVFRRVSGKNIQGEENLSETMKALRSVTGNMWIDQETFEKVVYLMEEKFSETPREMQRLLSDNNFQKSIKPINFSTVLSIEMQRSEVENISLKKGSTPITSFVFHTSSGEKRKKQIFRNFAEIDMERLLRKLKYEKKSK